MMARSSPLEKKERVVVAAKEKATRAKREVTLLSWMPLPCQPVLPSYPTDLSHTVLTITIAPALE